MEPIQLDIDGSPDSNDAKRLWLEVLDQAVRDAIHPAQCKGDEREHIRDDAMDFIFTDRSDFVFAIIDMDKDKGRAAIRQKILRETATGSPANPR